MHDAQAENDLRRKRLHEKVERDFTYHPPKGDQPERYDALRQKTKELAHLFVDLTPPDSLEQQQALFLLNLAVMSANANIARNE